MKKEKDIKILENIAKLLKETFKELNEIDDPNEIFNSDKALKVISKYSSINASLDELLYELVSYFQDLVFIQKEK